MTHTEILAKLEAGNTANLGPFYTSEEMKRVLADVQKTFPQAWVRRSPSSNNWLIAAR